MLFLHTFRRISNDSAPGRAPQAWRLNQAWAFAFALIAGIVLQGCQGIPTRSESSERKNLNAVLYELDPDAARKHVPPLTKDSTLHDYLLFAMLNQPAVQAAYFDWAGSVEDITVQRSMPDPQLTFQMDIQRIVTSLMPGLMQEFPGPGKLEAAGNMAAAQSKAKYFLFENSVLNAAFSLKKAYFELAYLDEKIRIDRDTLALLTQLEGSARAQNASGKVTLQDVYRAQIEQDRLTNEIANLDDSRIALLAQFKGALALRQDEPDPPMPVKFESTPLDLQGDQVLKEAFARNPKLRQMQAEVQMAEASIAVARKSAIPDFSAGIMIDAKTAPALYRPLGTMTLPIWRDKIAAQIASAQASKRAAQARLSAEQIMVGVDFAMKSYDYREVTRNLALLQDKLVPKARQSLEIARAGYLGGQIDFFNLVDAQRTWLAFQLEQVEARMRREIVLAELSLSIAGIAPEGAPILSGDVTDHPNDLAQH